ncbi:MAG: TCP-1/cpn60 chaperonin family protein [Caldilineaceae bacterium]
MVAGGGAALYHCIPALQAAASQESDEHVAQGMRLLAIALAAPLEQIIINSGEPAPKVFMQKICEAGLTATYDAVQHQVVDAFATGVLDVADVVAQMLHIAASGAMMALSTDAIVYHRKPKESLQPD